MPFVAVRIIYMGAAVEIAKGIRVEVAYALPDRQVLIALIVSEGTTAYEVIVQSGILSRFPKIDLAINPIGIFSKVLGSGGLETLSKYQVTEFDRVEIYRPLLVDPKEVRRQRAKAT